LVCFLLPLIFVRITAPATGKLDTASFFVQKSVSPCPELWQALSNHLYVKKKRLCPTTFCRASSQPTRSDLADPRRCYTTKPPPLLLKNLIYRFAVPCYRIPTPLPGASVRCYTILKNLLHRFAISCSRMPPNPPVPPWAAARGTVARPAYGCKGQR
jgi:hypothetical protein